MTRFPTGKVADMCGSEYENELNWTFTEPLMYQPQMIVHTFKFYNNFINSYHNNLHWYPVNSEHETSLYSEDFYLSVAFSIFRILYNRYLCLVPKYFPHTRRKLHTLCSYSLIFLPSIPWQPSICSLSPMDLPILGSSHKWNHIICDLLYLASFT